MKMDWKKLRSFLIVGALLAVMLTTVAMQKDPSAVMGTVNFYSGTTAITTTTYSNAPYIGSWSNDEIEVFISADAASTGALTSTLQVSYDNENWIDLYSDYISNSASVSGTMTTLTAWAEHGYSVVLSSIVSTTTSADYIVAPLRGLYMRVKMEPSGTITPVIKGVRR